MREVKIRLRNEKGANEPNEQANTVVVHGMQWYGMVIRTHG